jgi:CubicO group peptidase (beta-lactamase class C family)
MINIKVVFAIWAIFVFFSCSDKTKQVALSTSEKFVKSQVDSILKTSDLPGLVAIAVVREGEKLAYTYGDAIWGAETPISTDNIFRIASMTKLVTSIAALQLVEQDSLQLDENLSQLMPEMTSIPILTDDDEMIHPKVPITLRHLLTHTSGFVYRTTDALLSTFDRSGWEHDDLPRRFESGKAFLYGTSTDWVGKVVEKITGLTLVQYFRKNITGPLRIDRTWFNLPDTLKKDIVSYGKRGDDGTKPLSELPNRIPPQTTENYSGGGGLFSSPEDYNRLLLCLLNDGVHDGTRILEKETIDAMFEPQLDAVSMDISGNYFQEDLCCDFRGLIKPTSNWGLAGLIDSEPTDYGRKAGTLLCGGVYNTYWFIDRKTGIAASIFTQHLPFNHQATTEAFEEFSKLVYENY